MASSGKMILWCGRCESQVAAIKGNLECGWCDYDLSTEAARYEENIGSVDIASVFASNLDRVGFL
jgi:hypothetical protein